MLLRELEAKEENFNIKKTFNVFGYFNFFSYVAKKISFHQNSQNKGKKFEQYDSEKLEDNKFKGLMDFFLGIYKPDNEKENLEYLFWLKKLIIYGREKTFKNVVKTYINISEEKYQVLKSKFLDLLAYNWNISENIAAMRENTEQGILKLSPTKKNFRKTSSKKISELNKKGYNSTLPNEISAKIFRYYYENKINEETAKLGSKEL
ncbi:MAG: hypothetical protein J0H68_03340 [Sphingobacteriia bacterium]|nr:hypothetical protein [Sphingobacteriia bacterium]